jgi:hypothetical protein
MRLQQIGGDEDIAEIDRRAIARLDNLCALDLIFKDAIGGIDEVPTSGKERDWECDHNVMQ